MLMWKKKGSLISYYKNQWSKNLKNMPEEQHKQKSVRIVLFEVSLARIDELNVK